MRKKKTKNMTSEKSKQTSFQLQADMEIYKFSVKIIASFVFGQGNPYNNESNKSQF